MATEWSVSGTYFETCNCDAVCPCVVLNAPTQGSCTAVLAWHIEKGTFEKMKLDGLNVALMAHAPGHMMETKWKVALYLDDHATTEQASALAQIFSGQAGGHLSALGPLIGQVLGIKPAPIVFQAQGRTRSLSVSGIASVEIEALTGQNNAEVVLTNHPFTAVPDVPFVVAKSKHARYDDYNVKLEVSGKNGFYSPFRYASA